MTAPGVYKHNKTGNLYMVTGTAVNATNGPLNGTKMVKYESLTDGEEYVRDEAEFNSPGRFTYVHGPRKEDT